jgi:hypothetical protein
MENKNFVGYVKIVQGQFGEIVKISLNSDDLDKLKQSQNEKGYVAITMFNSKNGGKYMVVDKPLTKEEYQQLMNNNLSKSPKKEQPVIENEDDEINLEEIPF